MTAPDDGYVTETWTYAGVRLDGDKRTHAWADPDGKIRYWPDRHAYAVGSVYEMEIRRDDAGKIWRRGDPQFTAGQADDTTRAGWEIAHEHAERRLRRAAAEKRAKRDGGLIDAACKPICEIAAGVKSFTDLEALIASVRARLIDAWDKGPAS